MTPSAELPSKPPAKRVAAAIIAMVLLTMGLLVWFDTKGVSPDATITQQKDGVPLLSFQFLDKATYEEKGDDLSVSYPSDMAALDGKKVAIAGFMTPFEQLDDMREFLLMPSSGGCFFCQAPSLSQVAMVQQAKQAGDPDKLPFVQEPIVVTATLHLYTKDSKNPAHQAGFIFALDNARISKMSDAAAQAAGLGSAPPLVRK